MADISAIRTALDTHLTAVTQLRDVNLGRVMDFTGFPAVRYYLIGIRDQDMDTNSQYRTYIFGIDIIHSLAINGVTRATIEQEFQDAVDATLDKLNQEWNLDGSVHYSIPNVGTVREEEWYNGPVLYLSLTLEAKTLVSLS